MSRCGTHTGYVSHRKRGEAACDPCREAHRLYTVALKRRRLYGDTSRKGWGEVSGTPKIVRYKPEPKPKPLVLVRHLREPVQPPPIPEEPKPRPRFLPKGVTEDDLAPRATVDDFDIQWRRRARLYAYYGSQ